MFNNIFHLSNGTLVNLLLFGSPNYTVEVDNKLIKALIRFILTSDRFSGTLM